MREDTDKLVQAILKGDERAYRQLVSQVGRTQAKRLIDQAQNKGE